MKKLIILFITIIPFLCTSSANNLDYIENNNIHLVISAEKVLLSSPIIISNSNILFPLREICEKLSLPLDNLTWDKTRQAVKIIYNDKELIFKINSNVAKINNLEVLIPCAPVLYKNQTYIPIRTLNEFLDYFTIWDESSKTIFIKNAKDYFETNAFFSGLNSVISNVYNVQIDIINEINNASFGNSIYIDTRKNQIMEKNILNNTWHESSIKLTSSTTLEEINYLSTLSCGMNLNNKLSSENYYVYEGYFPAKSGKLSYGKLYVNVINLYIEKMVTETKTSLGTLKQNVIFRYGDCLV